MKSFYIIKMVIYGWISAYIYDMNPTRGFWIAWLVLSLLMIMFYLKEYFEEIQKSLNNKNNI